jgi:hypothetical protein
MVRTICRRRSSATLPSVFFQLASRHRINAIAFAEGWPVQTVGLVEHHFVILRLPGRSLCSAVQYFNKLLARSARGVRDHHYGMRAPAQVGLINLQAVAARLLCERRRARL